MFPVGQRIIHIHLHRAQTHLHRAIPVVFRFGTSPARVRPMMNVTYSNQMETLVRALATALPAPGQLFDGPWLIIPGRPVETFADLELARQRGISGNLDTMSMAGAFARLCNEAAPEVVLIDRLHVVGELLAFLATRPGLRLASGDDALGPLDAYLVGAGADADAVDRRRVAVARAVASLFGAWALTCPERLARWREGRGEELDGDEGPTDDPRLWRALRQLWTVLFGPAGRFAQRSQDEGRRYLTLDGFLDERLDRAWRPPPAVHVFGLTELPAGLQRPLDRLAARTALSIYAINPCQEFWEDVQTTRRPERARPRITAATKGRGHVSERQLAFDIGVPAAAPVPAALSEEGENPFLAAWGLASRDTVRRLDALCDANADHRTDTTSEPATLLAQLQLDIATRAPLRTGARRLQLPADGSLVVMEAPDPRRAWEAIAAEIWELVRSDGARRHGQPPLRFSDIAVLVAGPDEPYLPLAPSVFREANDLPHALVDGPLPSRIPEAILGLLALPGGELSRREVLDVVTHPNIKARFPDADADAWLALCEALGIARGADQRAFSGTYVERDVFNWDQGLRRLALGRFATGPRSGDERPLPLAGPRGDERYLPAEVAPDFRDDADALALLARSLLADVRFARDARLPIGDWLRFVHALVDAYLSPLSTDDEAARLRVFAALDGLAAAHRADTPVRLTVALPLIQEAIGQLRGTRGQIFGSGVAVGSLAALQSLPFRVIFVLGLGPERFPAADRPLPFDPGGPERAGELTPRQRDRWLFLQALLAARERLYLSYVDRDPLSGDRREASAVLLELMETLRHGYAEPASWTRAVPIRRDADPRSRAAFPIAEAEAEARALGRQLALAVPAAARLPDAAVVQALAPETRAALAPLLGTVPPPPARLDDRGLAARAAGPGRRPLRLDDLRGFLESPLQGGARVALGLRTVDDDTAARETTDEPLGVPRLVDRRILGELFLREWRGAEPPSPEELARAYDEALLTQRLAWLLPAGPFAAAARARHLELLATWREAIVGAPALVRGPTREIVYGRPDPDLKEADVRPALRLTIALGERPVEVELQGRLCSRLAVGDAQGSLTLGSSSNGDEDRDGLRPFLEHLLLAATGGPTAPSRHLIIRPRSGGEGASATELVLAAVEPERARTYLTELVTALFSRPHDYLLPCEAVFRAWKDREKDATARTLHDRIIETRDDPYYRGSSHTQWGPVPQPFAYPPPSPEEGEQLAEQRFGLFFGLRQFVRKAKDKSKEKP